MFQIRNDVEIPTQAHRPGPRSMYPLAEMQVGNSFFVPIPEGKTSKDIVSRLKTQTWQWRKRNSISNVKFAIQETLSPDNGETCIGVWRVA